MNSDELWYQYSLSYDDQLKYLKNKYGQPSGNYYLTEECKSGNSKIKRGKDGLAIHHDKEWNPEDITCHSLSSKDLALKYPYEYQLAHNLTYCNILEHLVLHIKIFLLRREAMGGLAFIDGVESYIIPQINDLYQTKRYKQEWLVATKANIEDNYTDYIALVNIYGNFAQVDQDYLLSLTQR